MSIVDDLNDIDSPPVATTESNRGTYDIVVSGGLDNNYCFDLQNGSLLVTGPVFTFPFRIDFGNVNKDETATESVNIVNAGDGVLTVSAINMPLGFTTDQTAFELATGNTATITLTFSPTEGKVYTGDLVLVSNDGTDLIALSGEGMPVTGIDDDVMDDNEVQIFPNPATHQLTIDVSGSPQVSNDVSLVDTKGVSRFILNTTRERIVVINVSSYETGICLLKIASEKGTVFKKVMIKC